MCMHMRSFISDFNLTREKKWKKVLHFPSHMAINLPVHLTANHRKWKGENMISGWSVAANYTLVCLKNKFFRIYVCALFITTAVFQAQRGKRTFSLLSTAKVGDMVQEYRKVQGFGGWLGKVKRNRQVWSETKHLSRGYFCDSAFLNF